MPTAADYAATASSVYDPQAQAESASASQGLASTNASLNAQDRTVKSNAAISADNLKAAHESNNQNNDFAYTNALGGNSSGLEANTNNIEGNNYIKGLTTLNTNTNNEEAGIADERTIAQNNYNSTLSAITSKYSGIKSGYVADQLSSDRANAFTAQMAANSNAANLAAAKITADSYNQPKAEDPKVSLNNDIYSSLQGFLTRPKGYSESTILPALYKQYGGSMSPADIKNAFFNARKALGYG